ncbi:MAG TPA: plastocyanin/azurin family copper-binding protein [Methylomirabilota bacterium]|jgi:plastocyanin|nr:plastocyanin/azurin family copper-binding protein [Methylomirabilota bacterium]
MMRSAAGALGAVMIAATLAAGSDIVVVQRNKTFSPHEIQIRVGDRVVFVNEDEVTHNVYSPTPGLEFNIRSQQPGQSDVVSFSKPGVLEVRCAIHPKMKMRVTVTR